MLSTQIFIYNKMETFKYEGYGQIQRWTHRGNCT